MNILAIIPARAGSKGLPNKNILPLLCHPLISYSIKAGLDSKLINRVVVSTDSEKIAQISKDYGAEVPFIRPSKYSQDLSTDFEVFEHALNWLWENEQYKPDIIVQLRPTSPVRKIEIIDQCIEKCISSNCDSLRVVTESPITPYKMWHIDDEHLPMKQFSYIDGIFEPYNQPRQMLPKVYWQIGFLDVIKANTITLERSMTGSKILPFVVDNIFAIDIDNLQSFDLASNIISNKNYVNFDI
jgi:CMP-N,N'-diacetyllegionaminic acid synthase